MTSGTIVQDVSAVAAQISRICETVKRSLRVVVMQAIVNPLRWYERKVIPKRDGQCDWRRLYEAVQDELCIVDGSGLRKVRDVDMWKQAVRNCAVICICPLLFLTTGSDAMYYIPGFARSAPLETVAKTWKDVGDIVTDAEAAEVPLAPGETLATAEEEAGPASNESDEDTQTLALTSTLSRVRLSTSSSGSAVSLSSSDERRGLLSSHPR